MSILSTTLFSGRASYYAEHRPSYPLAALDVLRSEIPTPADAADIGAGTGIFSRALVQAGYRTVAVEPNADMRAEAASSTEAGDLRVVDGSGEETTLEAGSIDLVTVAQAFHWLKRDEAKREFRRISRPGGVIAIVWNARQFEANEFMKGYRAMLLQHAPEYQAMKNSFWKTLDGDVSQFLGSASVRHTFVNPQIITRESMLGNLLSTSYVPKSGTTGYEELVETANRLFDTHQQDDRVVFELKTVMHTGNVADLA
ncbi:class I SAM-dependent methyltransferase [Variovorax saccharolyticus]|uniref:class I SAM-dependent methyltransferase n=1 Tax=Variovorax saccharolyticus TaxID=3053516 RepID=UPI0025781611|nr:class I SAM-dependent methyltransferase [Variovorax sp. J31P216]MDM0029105.1 class I SAM-dependent methyltransferase [Variovorax sp. J31P216]